MTPSRASLRRSPTAHRHWAAWLVVALLWAQGLGVWHHTVHGPGLQPAAEAAAAEVAATAVSTDATATAGATEPGWRSPLHHTANSSDCRLLDQLLLADGLATPPLALAVLPPAVPALSPASVAQLALAVARPYLARAPPPTA